MKWAVSSSLLTKHLRCYWTHGFFLPFANCCWSRLKLLYLAHVKAPYGDIQNTHLVPPRGGLRMLARCLPWWGVSWGWLRTTHLTPIQINASGTQPETAPNSTLKRSLQFLEDFLPGTHLDHSKPHQDEGWSNSGTPPPHASTHASGQEHMRLTPGVMPGSWYRPF